MKTRHVLLIILFGAVLSIGGAMAEELVLDDFSDADGVSAIGTGWEGFTDQVMGGRSEMQTRFLSEEGRIFLRMEGDVSLENRGGFIQVRLLLRDDGGYFDASSYRGFKIRYRTLESPAGDKEAAGNTEAAGDKQTAGGGAAGRTPDSTEEGGYYLHLRTSQNRFPWAHFAAKIPSSPTWTEAYVAWEDFEKQYSMVNNPKIGKLKSVAVTAGRAAFRASIDIGYIGLY